MSDQTRAAVLSPIPLAPVPLAQGPWAEWSHAVKTPSQRPEDARERRE